MNLLALNTNQPLSLYFKKEQQTVECSNTSICGTGQFCNYDFYETGFCENCREEKQDNTNWCEAAEFLYSFGTEDCIQRCMNDDKPKGI